MRDGWEKTTLGALCTITKGNSPTQKTPPGPYPLVVTGPEPLSSSSYQFDGEAVCVPLVSSTGHGHASLKRVHYASGRFAVANIIAACLPRNDAGVDARFLFHYLQHFKDAVIVPRMKGTANVSLSITNLAMVPVALPPLEEQRRMVDLIAAVDDAVEAAEAEVKSVAELLGAILDANAHDETAAIGSVATVVSGASWGKADVRAGAGEGVTPVLTIANTRPGGDVSGQPTFVHGLSGTVKRLTPSSLIAIRTNGNHERIGNIYRVPEAHVGAAVSAFQFVVEPMVPTDGGYLYWSMRAPRFQTALTAQASGTTGLGNIGAGKLREMRVAWPGNRDERDSLVAQFDGLGDAEQAARASADALRTLRRNLLAALLSGQHDIPSSYDALLEEVA